MLLTLTFKTLSAGIGPGYALGWAFTLEISCRSGTVGVGFELGLSRVGSNVVALII